MAVAKKDFMNAFAAITAITVCHPVGWQRRSDSRCSMMSFTVIPATRKMSRGHRVQVLHVLVHGCFTSVYLFPQNTFWLKRIFI